jgi:hypothetical protein
MTAFPASQLINQIPKLKHIQPESYTYNLHLKKVHFNWSTGLKVIIAFSAASITVRPCSRMGANFFSVKVPHFITVS